MDEIKATSSLGTHVVNKINWYTPNFKDKFYDQIRNHPLVVSTNREGNILKTKLRLDSGEVVEIEVDMFGSFYHKKYDGGRFCLPKVVCRHFWLRHETDWHIVGNVGQLCWIFPPEWDLSIKWWLAKHNDLEKVVSMAVDLFVSRVEYLLRIHLVAFKRGLVKWRQEWGGFPHDFEKSMILLCPKLLVSR